MGKNMVRNTSLSTRARIALLLALAAASSLPAHAQYKCTQPDGRVGYQQTPCAADAREKRLQLDGGTSAPGSSAAPASPPAASGDHWSAIAAGRPAVGMTMKQLESALGSPSRANLSQTGAETDDELIFFKDNRTFYVYVRNGVVISFLDQDGGAPKVRETAERRCPTPQQIKSMEFEASRIVNRNNHRLWTELARARACQ